MMMSDDAVTAVEVRPAEARKNNARVKRYARARQYKFRQVRMERDAAAKGLTVHTKCLCGCGLVIKPSLKRPFFRGHAKRAQGVLRVIQIPYQEAASA